MYLAQHGLSSDTGVINDALKHDFEVPEWSKVMVRSVVVRELKQIIKLEQNGIW